MRVILLTLTLLLSGCNTAEIEVMDQVEITEYKEVRPLQETFESLLSYYREHHPQIAGSLNVPASDTDIASLEKLIGHELPIDFKQLYKLADGQKDENTPLFHNGYEFMSLKDIATTYEMMMKLYKESLEFQEVYDNSDAILDTWWHPQWIPFGYMISGDHFCIDLSPGTIGKSGQVIEFIHDDAVRYHLGFSINDYLGELDRGLRSGKYFMHPEDKVITDEE